MAEILTVEQELQLEAVAEKEAVAENPSSASEAILKPKPAGSKLGVQQQAELKKIQQLEAEGQEPLIKQTSERQAQTEVLEQIQKGNLEVPEDKTQVVRQKGFAFLVQDGTPNNDTFIGTQFSDIYNGNKGDDKIFGRAGNDVLIGGGENDLIQGDEGDDLIYGESDPNTDPKNIGLGNDTLKGGRGNDNISGQNGNDWAIGGIGNDTLSGGDGKDSLEGNDGDDIIFGEDGEDWVRGNGGQDILTGGSGNDTVDGGTGRDVLYGDGIGRSSFTGGNDTVIGGGGDDEMYGGIGDDFLKGGNGNDEMFGGQMNDLILGHGGNDKLTGTDIDFFGIFSEGFGVGERDTLSGGKNNDVFVLGLETANARDENGNDTVIEDVILYNNSFTNNPGINDYALITDFGFEGDTVINGLDRIQLAGKESMYSLGASPTEKYATGIFLTEGQEEPELIGVLRGTSVESLDLSDSNQFIYV